VNVAVLTLTRDRLAYTQHCFTTLRWLAGCEFDHYVLDNGSQDGSPEWLVRQMSEGHLKAVTISGENIGCCAGWNALLDEFPIADTYDVVVCFDNDCEVIQEDTLKTVCRLVDASGWILAPRVDGLMYPPAAIDDAHFTLGEYDYWIEETTILGNIFMAIPAKLLEDFRWDEDAYQVWDGGESITPWYRAQGGHCGYVPAFRVNHYKTTLGQKEDMPWYAERRIAEGGRAQ
jgi:hypothetical protein